jgi:hypothetical protein
MTTFQRILLFFVLPAIAPLLFPPSVLANGILGIVSAIALFVLLGIFLLQGRLTALTLSIFLQGLSVIVRLMMLFPNMTFQDGSWDYIYILTTILSIALSMYLLLRLDKVDIRAQMVR